MSSLSPKLSRKRRLLSSGQRARLSCCSTRRLNAGDGLIEVRRIDAAKEVAETLARSRGVTYLPSGGAGGGGSNMLLGLNTGQ